MDNIVRTCTQLRRSRLHVQETAFGKRTSYQLVCKIHSGMNTGMHTSQVMFCMGSIHYSSDSQACIYNTQSVSCITCMRLISGHNYGESVSFARVFAVWSLLHCSMFVTLVKIPACPWFAHFLNHTCNDQHQSLQWRKIPFMTLFMSLGYAQSHACRIWLYKFCITYIYQENQTKYL